MEMTVLTAFAVTTIALMAVAWWNANHPVHRYDDEAKGEVLVSTDGRTITTVATWSGCEDRPRLVAQEDAGNVRLTLRREDHALPNQACDGGSSKQISTSLNQPLGSRQVTDALSGKRLPVFNERNLALPRYLPKGYVRTDVVTPGSSPAGENFPNPFETSPAPAWSTAYQRDFFHGYLAVTQVTGKVLGITGTPVTINGHQAFFQESPDLSVSWFDGTYTFNVCDHDPGQLPTREEFLTVAETLR
jgi:hypothetical protein